MLVAVTLLQIKYSFLYRVTHMYSVHSERYAYGLYVYGKYKLELSF